MKRKIVLWLIGLSLLLHAPWEFIQTELVVDFREKPWYIQLRDCAVGTTLDTLFTVGVYFLFAYYKKSTEWIVNAGVKEYLVIIIISLLAAYSYEWMGWKLGFWFFYENVTHLPESLGKVALSPLVQLPLLVSITFLIVQLIYKKQRV